MASRVAGEEEDEGDVVTRGLILAAGFAANPIVGVNFLSNIARNERRADDVPTGTAR
jgi:hypothetical protein